MFEGGALFVAKCSKQQPCFMFIVLRICLLCWTAQVLRAACCTLLRSRVCVCAQLDLTRFAASLPEAGTADGECLAVTDVVRPVDSSEVHGDRTALMTLLQDDVDATSAAARDTGARDVIDCWLSSGLAPRLLLRSTV